MLSKSRALRFSCALISIMALSFSSPAQVTISGPTCVIPGVVYQYIINGPWDSTSTMQVCLSGGVIADSTNTNTCTASGGAPLGAVLVVWTDSSSGSLTLNSTKGNGSLSVSITRPLSAGGIDTSTQVQIIGYDSTPASINCAVDTGGSCSPYYADQWQQSTDMLAWTDITGATGENLSFSSPLTQTTFFRRKVTDTTSGSIAFSNPAVVNVFAQLEQSDSTDSSTGWLLEKYLLHPRYGTNAGLVAPMDFALVAKARLRKPDRFLPVKKSSEL